jgi:hypothetical protein
MKNLVISKILLWSDIERRARRVDFHPQQTTIIGANNTGKSSLMKSIYSAFGAESARQDARWLSGKVKVLVSFSLDAQAFSILRDGNRYSVFNSEGQLLKSTNRVTNDLSIFLADLFDFRLTLPAREGRGVEIPPPAFLFLPFYIDQDASWVRPWSAFDRLQQYADWKVSVAEYHLGIRENQYYDVLGHLYAIQHQLQELRLQRKGLETALAGLETVAQNSTFSINLDAFQGQVGRLIKEASVLAERENHIKDQLTELSRSKLILTRQLQIAKKAIGEIRDDFEFLTRYDSDSVECPTCGTSYENDFIARFSIASDEDKLLTFVSQIDDDIREVEGKQEGIYRQLDVARDQVARVNEILATSQADVTLEMIIESEGRRAADSLLKNQVAKVDVAIGAAAAQEEPLRVSLEALDRESRARRQEVTAQFSEILRSSLRKLRVDPFTDIAYKSLTGRIDETGSSLPRALLGYYFTFLNVMVARSPATFCPIVLDSPNQQAQDDESLSIMLNFIRDQQPRGSQMILALEKDMGMSFNGSRVELEEKLHLLSDTEYDRVKEDVRFYLEESLRSR